MQAQGGYGGRGMGYGMAQGYASMGAKPQGGPYGPQVPLPHTHTLALTLTLTLTLALTLTLTLTLTPTPTVIP